LKALSIFMSLALFPADRLLRVSVSNNSQSERQMPLCVCEREREREIPLGATSESAGIKQGEVAGNLEGCPHAGCRHFCGLRAARMRASGSCVHVRALAGNPRLSMYFANSINDANHIGDIAKKWSIKFIAAHIF